MGLAGASAYAEASPLQRHWLDVTGRDPPRDVEHQATMETTEALLGEPLITGLRLAVIPRRRFRSHRPGERDANDCVPGNRLGAALHIVAR